MGSVGIGIVVGRWLQWAVTVRLGWYAGGPEVARVAMQVAALVITPRSSTSISSASLMNQARPSTKEVPHRRIFHEGLVPRVDCFHQ